MDREGYRRENTFVRKKGVKLAQVYFEILEQHSLTGLPNR